MTEATTMAGGDRLELWGGVECTVARVGDDWRNQIVETGHWARPGDLDLIADLGIRTVRYPILWETIAPDSLHAFDFSWTDERLAMLRERGIEVIGGLLHHGSGPHYTSLLDLDFADKLAVFARRAAERYPWITQWTPVNEPLTTARFSGLYGHWYPHHRSNRSFLRALVNECVGTAVAMRAIREIIPNARLVQTEDLGKTFATARLQGQAEYENVRRWLSLDLLCGRVDLSHPLYRELLREGVQPEEIASLSDGAGRPDIIGINHYLTSERYLDHRLDLYPDHAPGGNGRDVYVDVEAVRIEALHDQTGIGLRLTEAWERYGIPIAVTEVHHGCTRDEQLRWFAQVWDECLAVRDSGVDLRGVTLWSMFGNVDWRSLLTRRDGVFDVGVFDARGPEPRPTIIAAAARAFAAGERFDHPVLDMPGWWKRPQRLYPWHGSCKTLESDGRKLLITGATGRVGPAMAAIAEHRGLPFCLTDRAELDVTDTHSVERAIARHQPWAVIDTSGSMTDVPARACAQNGLPLVRIAPAGSDGSEMLEHCRAQLIVRTSELFGSHDEREFAWHALETLRVGRMVEAEADVIVSPTFIPDLCHAMLDLLIDDATGIWTLVNRSRMTRADLAREIARRAGYEPGLVRPVHGAKTETAAPDAGGFMLRPLSAALDDYLRSAGQFAHTEQAVLAAE